VSVHDLLDELTDLVTAARAMPMSASCIVNRGQVLDIVDDIRAALPDQIREADALIEDREQVLEAARAESAAILVDAEEQKNHLVSQEWVYAAAVREAEVVRSDAEADAARMRRETDDYVDGKLANFEVALQKILVAVERGRDKIRTRNEAAADPLDEEPLPG
jgi:cell division septum initiation protein DivIVA